MKIRKPKIIPEFYTEPEPRVLYVVRSVDGSLCNVEDAQEAADMLEDQCDVYVRMMKRFSNATDPPRG